MIELKGTEEATVLVVGRGPYVDEILRVMTSHGRGVAQPRLSSLVDPEKGISNITNLDSSPMENIMVSKTLQAVRNSPLSPTTSNHT